jgi:hypothetical protein
VPHDEKGVVTGKLGDLDRVRQMVSVFGVGVSSLPANLALETTAVVEIGD